jgi:hypothetical protein
MCSIRAAVSHKSKDVPCKAWSPEKYRDHVAILTATRCSLSISLEAVGMTGF